MIPCLFAVYHIYASSKEGLLEKIENVQISLGRIELEIAELCNSHHDE